MVHDPEGWSVSYWVGGGGGGGQILINVLESPYFQVHGISVIIFFQIRPFFLFPGELSFTYLHDH